MSASPRWRCPVYTAAAVPHNDDVCHGKDLAREATRVMAHLGTTTFAGAKTTIFGSRAVIELP